MHMYCCWPGVVSPKGAFTSSATLNYMPHEPSLLQHHPRRPAGERARRGQAQRKGAAHAARSAAGVHQVGRPLGVAADVPEHEHAACVRVTTRGTPPRNPCSRLCQLAVVTQLAGAEAGADAAREAAAEAEDMARRALVSCAIKAMLSRVLAWQEVHVHACGRCLQGSCCATVRRGSG